MIKLINRLNRLNLSKLKRRAGASGKILIVILSLDLHRYGAWYTNDATYIYPYGLPVLFLLGSPLILYVITAEVQSAVKHGRYMLLYMSGVYLFCFILSFFLTFPFLFKYPAWYDTEILRPIDLTFIKGAALMFTAPLATVAALWLLGRIYRCVIEVPQMVKGIFSK